MPSFRSTGGIFARLDSSGNLNFYDSAGNSIAKFVSGSYSTKLALSTFTTSSSQTTTSSTAVSTGLGFSFTPQVSTRSIVGVALTFNKTTTGQVLFDIVRTTGAIPSVGSAAGLGVFNNSAGNSLSGNEAIASSSFTLAGNAIDTGLTVGTAYNYYISFWIGTGAGTLQFTSANVFAGEV